MDVDAENQEEDENRRLVERWKFDMDDSPAIGPEGPEEQFWLMIMMEGKNLLVVLLR
jgi:enhancer of polycomb-like protein